MHDNRVSAAHKTALSVLHSWEQQQLKVDVANRWRQTLALPCGTPCSRRSMLLWRLPHGVLNRQEQKAVSLRSIGNYKIAWRWPKVTKRHSFSKSLVAGMWFNKQKFPIRWNRDKQACARALPPLPPVHWFTGKYKDSHPSVVDWQTSPLYAGAAARLWIVGDVSTVMSTNVDSTAMKHCPATTVRRSPSWPHPSRQHPQRQQMSQRKQILMLQYRNWHFNLKFSWTCWPLQTLFSPTWTAHPCYCRSALKPIWLTSLAGARLRNWKNCAPSGTA